MHIDDTFEYLLAIRSGIYLRYFEYLSAVLFEVSTGSAFEYWPIINMNSICMLCMIGKHMNAMHKWTYMLVNA